MKYSLFTCCLTVITYLSVLFTTIAQAQFKFAGIDTTEALKFIKYRDKNEYIAFEKGNRQTPISFFDQYPEVYGLDTQTKPILKHEETDDLGITHSRFGLSYWGYEVEDSDYWFHAKNGELSTANGYLPEIPKNLALPEKIMSFKDAITKFSLLEEKLKIKKMKDHENNYETNLVWATPEKDTTDNKTKNAYFLAWLIKNKRNNLIAYVNAETGQLCY
jgi:hypothetical protein